MAAGMLMPMVRFALDPVLQKHAGGDFVLTEQKSLTSLKSLLKLTSHLNKLTHGTNLMLQTLHGFIKAVTK